MGAEHMAYIRGSLLFNGKPALLLSFFICLIEQAYLGMSAYWATVHYSSRLARVAVDMLSSIDVCEQLV